MTLPRPGRPSLVEQITATLSREIVSGQYNAAKRLPTEPQLSSKFGVSRTVVREATRLLVSRGLVEVQRGRGVSIINQLHQPFSRSLELRLPDAKDRLEKLIEARRLIEPGVARLAALRAKPAHLRQLRELHLRLSAATESETASEIDLEFHRVLTRTAGNEIFELMLESVADLGRESRRATNADARWPQAISGHAEILAAIERGDGEQAERAMAAHLDLAAATLGHYFMSRSSRS